jgi:RNA polymerase sigma factor (TIGR02999 family)
MHAGKEGASEALFSLLYEELHARARRYMQDERPGHTLQTTALVHEAYLQLGLGGEPWESRAHFLGTAARVMRQILIQHARRKHSAKRGGDRAREPFHEAVKLFEHSSVDLLALDTALSQLAEIDPRAARVVELRFFGGLSIEETARVLAVSTRTVNGDWKTAKAWLKYNLDRGAE